MENPQAEQLNELLKGTAIYSMLSKKGKAIFFPKKGILSQSAEAKDKNINATIGMGLEDDGSPMALSTITKRVNLDKPDCFNYAPSYGKKEIRDKWKEMLFEKNPSMKGKNISLPVVSSALTHGLSMCAYLFLNPNEEIIVPEPYWGNYNLIFNKGYDVKLKKFPLFVDNNLNITGYREAVESRGDKKVVLFNFPNNPTGYTPKNEQIDELVKIIKDSAEKGKKIIALIDDAYFGLVYESGIYKESIFTKLCDLHENVLAIKIDGATKEDYVWGFRIGFITYGMKGVKDYTPLEDKTAGAIRGNISNAAHISQSLLLQSFNDSDYKKEKKSKYNILFKRYQKVRMIIDEHEEYNEYFSPMPFNSGYFMCLKLNKENAEEIRHILLKKYSTGIIAMRNVIRVAFSGTPYDKIDELFNNIFNACKEGG